MRTLIPKDELARTWVLRKVLNPLSPVEAMETPMLPLVTLPLTSALTVIATVWPAGIAKIPLALLKLT